MVEPWRCKGVDWLVPLRRNSREQANDRQYTRCRETFLLRYALFTDYWRKQAIPLRRSRLNSDCLPFLELAALRQLIGHCGYIIFFRTRECLAPAIVQSVRGLQLLTIIESDLGSPVAAFPGWRMSTLTNQVKARPGDLHRAGQVTETNNRGTNYRAPESTIRISWFSDSASRKQQSQ